MTTIWDLKPGDELICWPRIGLNPQLVRARDGAYVTTPSKPTRFKTTSYDRFRAYVVSNDSANNLITLRVSKASTNYLSPSGESYLGRFHYSSFARVRLVSPYSHEPTPPQNKTPFEARRYPYRTVVDVKLHK